MNEEIKKETEDKKPEGEPENSGEGDKPQTTSLINRADLAAERLEKDLRKESENLNRREALMARDALGGRTYAGQSQPQLSEEEKKKAGAKEFFKGTQLEKDIEKL